MQIILEANDLWEIIEPLESTQADNKKDKTAIAFLYQALPEEQLLQITKHKTAKAIWDALKTRHMGEERVQQARLQTLKSEFEILYMKEDETIDTFTAKLTTIVNKAVSLGHTMEDETLVRKLLNAIPDRTKSNEQSNLVEEDLEPTLLMTILEDEEQKVSLHEEDVGYKETNMNSLWYLDNGASNHMTGVREHFKELDEKVSGKLDDRSTKMVYLGNEQGSKAYRLFDPTTQRVCVSRDVKFKEDETWDWKDYMSKHINDKPEWTNFKIGNLEVTNEQHDQETQPIEDDNEFPNNDDDYASPSRDSPLHSQTPHTPSTRSSEINSQVTPNFSTQSYYQSDNDSIQITNSPSHFDHTPLRGFRTLNDLYENTEELLLAEDEPKNYKEASSDQKWIEAMKVELDSINRNNTWELNTHLVTQKDIKLK
ncbi:zinc finger, CCHC-type containing protein [Tanacetum coccineum]